MTRRSLIRFFTLLFGAVLLLAPAVRAGDIDIIPEKRGFVVQLISFDALTGVLYGFTSGPAGTGNVSLQIQDVTRPRRAPLARFTPQNPVLPVAQDWNATLKAIPSNPVKVWGAVASSPFSALLSQAIPLGGFVKVRINKDLFSVRTIKLYPTSPI